MTFRGTCVSAKRMCCPEHRKTRFPIFLKDRETGFSFFIWWSGRNQGRTLSMIRYSAFKVFFYLVLVQQNIVQNDGPLSTVEKQGHPVIVEIDCPEKDIDDSAPGIFIVYISALERIQE